MTSDQSTSQQKHTNSCLTGHMVLCRVLPAERSIAATTWMHVHNSHLRRERVSAGTLTFFLGYTAGLLFQPCLTAVSLTSAYLASASVYLPSANSALPSIRRRSAASKRSSNNIVRRSRSCGNTHK